MDPKELQIHLDAYLKSTSISDVCPNGLQVEGARAIRRVATAVSANIETIEKAIDVDVEALIVHHGLFWDRDPYPIIGVKRKKIELLLKNGITLFAYHLPLDAHQECGNNWKAAKDLGWENLQAFGNYKGTLIGVKGTFSSRPIEKFVKEIEGYYAHTATCALGGKKEVESAALISGGAYKEIASAAAEGVDCFITGNFDEPAWSLAYEEKVHFLALGHTATEKVGVQALADYIQKKLGIPSLFLDSKNPF